MRKRILDRLDDLRIPGFDAEPEPESNVLAGTVRALGIAETDAGPKVVVRALAPPDRREVVITLDQGDVAGIVMLAKACWPLD